MIYICILEFILILILLMKNFQQKKEIKEISIEILKLKNRLEYLKEDNRLTLTQIGEIFYQTMHALQGVGYLYFKNGYSFSLQTYTENIGKVCVLLKVLGNEVKGRYWCGSFEQEAYSELIHFLEEDFHKYIYCTSKTIDFDSLDKKISFFKNSTRNLNKECK